jgi:putative FmdB family regulatory protein
MPTYEYVCDKCGAEFELFQSISAKPLTICPKEQCAMKRWGKGKVQKKISAGAGLLFKGSGFYITDYRSENYKAAAKKDSGASPAPAASSGDGKGASSASGGESKPAAKPAEAKPAKASKSK